MKEETSRHISVLSFVATIMVVYRHGLNFYNYNLAQNDINLNIQVVYSMLSNIAVPVFFIISGYLYFLNLSFGNILYKWKKRIKTLFIPYLLWNIIIMTLIILSYFIDKKGQISNYNLNYDMINIIRGLTIRPYAEHFWYIRDLILFIIISPIILLIKKYKTVFLFLILFLMYVWKPIDINIFSSEGLFFFLIGAALTDINGEFLIRYKYVIIFNILYILLLVVLVISQLNNSIIFKITTMLGVFLLYQNIFNAKLNSKSKILKLCKYSFFIYALHFPIIRGLNKISYNYISQTSLNSFMSFILIPLLLIGLIIMISFLMKKYCRGIYNILTGNR